MSESKHYDQMGVAMTCRSYTEYVSLFVLEGVDLQKGRILDVAAGASSFTAEGNAQGLQITAVDPLYQLDSKEIQSKGAQEIIESTAKLAKLKDRFNWSYYGTLEAHQAGRERALDRFSVDYSINKDITYINANLPNLPFEENTFEIVLCSHFLFLYADQFDVNFHRTAIAELIRVCRPGGEVRIYPLLSLRWEPYSMLEVFIEEWESAGHTVMKVPTKLPFIPGSTEVLSIQKLRNFYI